MKIYQKNEIKVNYRKFCKNLKIVDGYLKHKGKRKVIFDNGRYRTR